MSAQIVDRMAPGSHNQSNAGTTMTITGLLTAQGGSSLTDKNILPVAGKPLLYYPAKAGKLSQHIQHFYVSSDCEKILSVGEEIGYTPIQRPETISRGDSQHVDAILHACEEIKNHSGLKPDILVVLLGNTVCTLPAWIDDCIEKIQENPDISSVIPCYEDCDHHPFRAKKINDDGFLDTFFDFSGQRISTNRQDLPPSYYACHNFWVLNVQKSLYAEGGQQPWSFMGEKILPYLLEDTIDVHDKSDYLDSEIWLKSHNIRYD
jgi:CMP-N-acetylneuraminic acid synthetase